jgi:hypothetical protein
LETPKPKYAHGEVLVSAYPDLYVDEEGTKKLIKLDFSEKRPDEQAVEIVLKVMHEAAYAAKLPLLAANVIYLDITRKTQYTGKKLNKQLKKNIDAASETIAHIWPRIKQA